MSTRKDSYFLSACIAVTLVAVIAIAGVITYGVKYKDKLNSDSSETSSMVNTAEVSSESSSSEAQSNVSQSSNVSSSNGESSDVSSVESTTASNNITSGGFTEQGTGFVNDGTPVCYLTFDDGPCKNTDTILKILEENDIKATFFVVGTMSTGKIKDIYNAGHSIGLHTNTHELTKSSSKYVYKNESNYFKDLQGISDVVYKKIGIRSNLVRFPGGSVTAYKRLGKDVFASVKQRLEDNGYTYFDWNIDSGDTHSKSPSKEYVMKEIRDGLYSNGKLKNEICILMHDIKNVTVEALPDIIKELKELGYTFRPLSSNSENFAFK